MYSRKSFMKSKRNSLVVQCCATDNIFVNRCKRSDYTTSYLIQQIDDDLQRYIEATISHQISISVQFHSHTKIQRRIRTSTGPSCKVASKITKNWCKGIFVANASLDWRVITRRQNIWIIKMKQKHCSSSRTTESYHFVKSLTSECAMCARPLRQQLCTPSIINQTQLETFFFTDASVLGIELQKCVGSLKKFLFFVLLFRSVYWILNVYTKRTGTGQMP